MARNKGTRNSQRTITTDSGQESALLYKYRSLGNWKYVLDIFLNKRLYAATFKEMNDPMEGRYYYYDDDVSRKFRQAIREQKDKWKICSLSRTARNTLMWSYYSDGHKGIAIGVKIRNGRRNTYKQHDVIYDMEVSLDPSKITAGAEAAAIHILSQKQLAWRHEQEVRIFSCDRFVDIEIEEVCFGCLVDPAERELVTALVDRTTPNVRLTDIDRYELDQPINDFAV